jgi:hypothetical protein
VSVAAVGKQIASSPSRWNAELDLTYLGHDAHTLSVVTLTCGLEALKWMGSPSNQMK